MSIPNTTHDPEQELHSRWSLFVGLVVRVSTWPGPCNSMKASRCRGTWPLYEIPFFFITFADKHLRLSFFWVLNIISATPEIKELWRKIYEHEGVHFCKNQNFLFMQQCWLLFLGSSCVDGRSFYLFLSIHFILVYFHSFTLPHHSLPQIFQQATLLQIFYTYDCIYTDYLYG